MGNTVEEQVFFAALQGEEELVGELLDKLNVSELQGLQDTVDMLDELVSEALLERS